MNNVDVRDPDRLLSGQSVEKTAVDEFNAKFALQDTNMQIGLLRLGNDTENQESAVMAIFQCSSLCAKYALLRADVLKQNEEKAVVDQEKNLKLTRQHELDLEHAKYSNKRQTAKKTTELNIADRFGNLIGSPLSDGECTVLRTQFSSFSLSILSGAMSPAVAKRIHKSMKLVLADKTLQVMRSRGYIFDGLLGPVAGGKAILYRVFDLETYQVCCGKVYLKSEEDDLALDNEIMTNIAIHKTGKKPNVAAFDKVLEFSHTLQCSIALIMLLYSISLRELLDAHGSELEINLFKKIAMGLLTAGKCFEDCALSHCDIKPDNIMLDRGSPVIIDFGSVARLGTAVEEYTRFYALDADSNKVGPDFDLNCIVVTLAMCFIPKFKTVYRTRQDMMEEMEKCRGNLVSYSKICIEALKYTSSSAALNGLQLELHSEPLPTPSLP